LDGLHLRKYFPVVVSAYDVIESKPHPETFLQCAQKLAVVPEDCIVFEDSPKGVEAAARAGMKAVVITTMHTKEEFDNNNIICFIEDYHNLFDQLVN
jgi:beta-phosphoglucomutase-like phosphatase (HAD superfamily)